MADDGGGVLSDSCTDRVREDLADAGLAGIGQVHRNLPYAELVARSLARKEGILASNGAIVVRTGLRTGRSPHDRFIVDSKAVHDNVDWGAVNKPCSRRVFDHLLDKASAFLQHRESFVFDGYAGADPQYRQPIRVVSEATWHGLFAHTLFLQPSSVELHERFAPAITVIDCGALTASPKADGARSEAFVGLDLERRVVLIVGTMYGGEIKKSVFSMLNYLLPERGVLPMHCAANMGRDGDTALFFGLSGTGKTTLSADPGRHLIGDDEHGWSDHGVFNFEGGCYAKVIRISPRAEPQIVRALRFGSILENVAIDPGPGRSTTTTTRSPRTRGLPTRSPTFAVTCRRAWAATRATSCFLPAMPTASCRRSPGSRPRWQATTSSRDSPRTSPAPRRG